MVYGAICWEEKCPLYFFKEGERENQENYKQILSTWMLPWSDAIYPGGDFIYYQDNARPHLGKKVFDWMSSVIKFIPEIPPYSPDFNPIENVWGILKTNVEKMQPQNIEDLQEKVEIAWKEIDQKIIQNCIIHTRNRIKEVLENNGDFC